MTHQLVPIHTSVTGEWHNAATTRLYGGWLVFVRILCIVLVAYTLGFFGTGLAIAFAHHQALCTGLTCVLPLPEALIYFAGAALIFWHKSDDWMALLVALMLVLLAPLSTLPEEILNLLLRVPVMGMLLTVSIYLALASFLLFCFLFPNGRFVPRWTRWVVAVSLLWFAYLIYDFFWLPGEVTGYQILTVVVLLLIVVFTQMHRYQEVSSPVERQQTKWAMVGASVAAWAWFVSLFSNISATRVILMLVPLSISIAVLRYRLYDIDVLINRALIYSALTGTLALVYFSLVFMLQFLLRGFIGQTNDLTIVISTLAVAALFQPLRRRIQSVIDRRFYRRKYDAAKTLAAFSVTLRNELDMDQLREQLVVVVQETMQPAHVSLWLRESEHKSNPNTVR